MLEVQLKERTKNERKREKTILTIVGVVLKQSDRGGDKRREISSHKARFWGML